MKMTRPWLEQLIGAWLLLLLMGLCLGLFSQMVPGDNPLGPLARMFDSLRVHILFAVLLGALLLLVLRRSFLAIACLVLSLVGIGAISYDYLQRSAPRGQKTDLAVLWFNVLKFNTTVPEELAAAFRDSGADIIVLAEAAPAQPAATLLHDLYPYQAGCVEPDPDRCNLLILSRLPLEMHELRAMASGPERLADFTVRTAAGPLVDIVAVHMSKPWYSALRGRDRIALHKQIRREREEPLIVLGDFNATSWSHDLLWLERRDHLLHPRWPVSTWPVSLGKFGLPIDHAMLRGGVSVTTTGAWGQALGSNHKGIFIGLELGRGQEESSAS